MSSDVGWPGGLGVCEEEPGTKGAAVAFSWEAGSEAERSAMLGGSSGGTVAVERSGAPGGSARGSLGAGVLLTSDYVRSTGPSAGADGGDEEGSETLGPTTGAGEGELGKMCGGSVTVGFGCNCAKVPTA
jgi:hypothetical protein